MIRPSRFPRHGKRPDASLGGSQGDEKARIRLALTRGSLGLELEGSIPLGPLSVDEVTIALAGLSFPIDLSGGVPRFRHRRGVLERLVVSGHHERLASQLAPRLRGVLGQTTPSLVIAPAEGGLMLGLHDGDIALAFDLVWAPRDGVARWIVASARGLGLNRPALAAALSAMDALTGRLGERQGAVVTLEEAPTSILREVLPPAGVRLPNAAEARFGALAFDESGFRLECDRAFSPPELCPRAIRELELAELAKMADDSLASGDYERARERYVALLERAPRHPALALRMAEIDRWVGERAEAALATLNEAMPQSDSGAVGGELLEKTGNHRAARLALARAAEAEPYAPLAALILLARARLAEDSPMRLRDLDEAVTRAPALSSARWARIEERLHEGDVGAAMADLEHLEAAARSAWNRHEVFRRAGEIWLARGHEAKAAFIFERALRYAPESPQAVSGLARSLLATGRTSRALELLSRAVELAERASTPAWEIVLSLAEALAEEARDLPAAIARARTIPRGQPETLRARGLEGRWRARLDDRAGASIAFAEMRDFIETATVVDEEQAALWLVEAARFERDRQGDEGAAEHYLERARKLAPDHPSVVAAALPELAKEPPREEPSLRPEDPLQALPVVFPPSEPLPAFPHVQFEDDDEISSSPEDEQRAETLADRLRADPTNHQVAVELADLLAKLGRDLDLFALLSARLEDVTGEEREELLPKQRAVLERLVTTARDEGREEEASLYELALTHLS